MKYYTITLSTMERQEELVLKYDDGTPSGTGWVEDSSLKLIKRDITKGGDTMELKEAYDFAMLKWDYLSKFDFTDGYEATSILKDRYPELREFPSGCAFCKHTNDNDVVCLLIREDYSSDSGDISQCQSSCCNGIFFDWCDDTTKENAVKVRDFIKDRWQKHLDKKDIKIDTCNAYEVKHRRDGETRLVIVGNDEVIYISKFGITYSNIKHLEEYYTIEKNVTEHLKNLLSNGKLI